LITEEELDKKVRKYLKIGRGDSILVGRDKKTHKIVSVIKFARAEWEDWEEIKKMTTEKLKERYISLRVCMDFSVSVRDCEFEALMAMELDRRGVRYSEIKPLIDKGISETKEYFEKIDAERLQKKEVR
jgi:hypothetical protein